jgi:hypothetical protein
VIQPAANAAASSGLATATARAPGTTRFASFVSTSPGPASTNVSAPADLSACGDLHSFSLSVV